MFNFALLLIKNQVGTKAGNYHLT